MKKQINNVNVEKASANAKANSLIALDVLKSVKEKNAGLFKTSLGTKTEIYKKELFEKCYFQFSFNYCNKFR